MLSNGDTLLLAHSTERVALLQDLNRANRDFELDKKSNNILCCILQTS